MSRFQQTAGICEVPRGLWLVDGMGRYVGLEEAHAVGFDLRRKKENNTKE